MKKSYFLWFGLAVVLAILLFFVFNDSQKKEDESPVETLLNALEERDSSSPKQSPSGAPSVNSEKKLEISSEVEKKENFSVETEKHRSSKKSGRVLIDPNEEPFNRLQDQRVVADLKQEFNTNLNRLEEELNLTPDQKKEFSMQGWGPFQLLKIHSLYGASQSPQYQSQIELLQGMKQTAEEKLFTILSPAQRKKLQSSQVLFLPEVHE